MCRTLKQLNVDIEGKKKNLRSSLYEFPLTEAKEKEKEEEVGRWAKEVKVNELQLHP